VRTSAPRARLRLVENREPQVTHDSYERITPGVYRAYCRAARIYWDPGYKKWLCLLRWDVLDAAGARIASIQQWLYIGRKRNAPHTTRRAQYWREWCHAHGGPPLRRDRMAAHVFTKRIARVLVGDSGASTQNGTPHYPYSVVRQIKEWETGSGIASTSVLQSHIPERQL